MMSTRLSETVAEKLARLLPKRCEQNGVEQSRGTSVQCLLTHEDLAEMISSSRETLTRLVGQFKKRQIVELMNNSVLI